MGVTVNRNTPRDRSHHPAFGRVPPGLQLLFNVISVRRQRKSGLNFYNSGDELFDILCQLENLRGTQSFFVMDENFLLYRKRALRLLELMEKHGKSWIFYVFSSS